ncbi:hypothetical protein Gocc_2089 [Gaiella occulta]|uniref:Uncharacterized protein n=2 Tax=Gaiella occulta TaxID=1002870 RepID=A0A7M2YV20_9ACTN|nr:hypothetical protein Gocc_2089 [Gaiella occulta]
MVGSTRGRVRRMRFVAPLSALVAAGLIAAAAFGSSGGAATSNAQAQEIAKLRAQLALTQQDARLWQQLVQNFRPAKGLGLNSMSDHEVLMLPSGLLMALHFDSMNLAKAKNLNWVAVGIPGVFTKADQARVNKLYGPGVTHFHDLKTDVHGGKPGTKGVWFIHIGARNFTSPFGKVTQGKIDPNFMPTIPPK